MDAGGGTLSLLSCSIGRRLRSIAHRSIVTWSRRSNARLPAGKQDRLLRANNDSVIKLNHVVHHGGIGHHVQNWNAYHGPSRIGQVAAVDCASRIAMFCGGTMAEGWACYATRLMDEQGFLTPLESLGEVHGDVRMCARAIVDVKLHRGEFTLEDAAQFYATRTAMSPEAAHGEAVKNSMFPGAAMMYLIGRDTILDLRAKLQRSIGQSLQSEVFSRPISFLWFGAGFTDCRCDGRRRRQCSVTRPLPMVKRRPAPYWAWMHSIAARAMTKMGSSCSTWPVTG